MIWTADDILTFRKRHEMTQWDLAKELGCALSTVGYWERGERLPDTYNQDRLSNLRKELEGRASDD